LELPQTQNKLKNTMAHIITKIKVRLQKIQLFYLLIIVHSYNQLLEVHIMRHTKMCLLKGWVNSFLIILICLGQTLTWQVRDFLQQDQDSHLQVWTGHKITKIHLIFKIYKFKTFKTSTYRCNRSVSKRWLLLIIINNNRWFKWWLLQDKLVTHGWPKPYKTKITKWIKPLDLH